MVWREEDGEASRREVAYSQGERPSGCEVRGRVDSDGIGGWWAGEK